MTGEQIANTVALLTALGFGWLVARWWGLGLVAFLIVASAFEQ